MTQINVIVFYVGGLKCCILHKVLYLLIQYSHADSWADTGRYNTKEHNPIILLKVSKLILPE